MDLDECVRPVQWLRTLEADPVRLVRVCGESGSLAQAAWRIASARCGTASRGPSRSELRSVAVELAVRVGYYDAVPSEDHLADECVRWGLAVRAA